MATVAYRLKGKGKNATIYLQFSIASGNVPMRSTGLAIDSSQWSKEKGLPKQNLAQNKVLANQLNKLRVEIYERYTQDQLKGIIIDSNWLKDEIDYFFERKSRSGKNESVSFWIQDYCNQAEFRNNPQTGGVGLDKSTIGKYLRLLELFNEYQGRKDTKIKEVGKLFADDFLKYLLKNKSYSLSYSRKLITNLKVICRYAGSYVEVARDLDKIKMPVEKELKDPIYLTKKELKLILDANITQPYLINARKWLIIGCYVGARVGDLLKLTEKNLVIDQDVLVFKYKMTKGGKTKDIFVPVQEEAKEVINQGFPHKISEQKLRDYFKEVCLQSGISKPMEGEIYNKDLGRKVKGIFPKYQLISTHTCRRSFCTNLYGRIPTATIMRASGHKKESTFLKYIGRDGYDYSDWSNIINQKN